MTRKPAPFRFLILLVLFARLALAPLLAAVGCELNDPDRDVKRLFPESTGYKTEYVSIARQGGEPLLRKIEARLGDTFKGLYETIDVSYTMYRIYKGTELIGYIHGVNQKGRYGGIQVFLALDLDGKIRSFYFQKLTNQSAGLLRDPAFGKQFVGLDPGGFRRLRSGDGYGRRRQQGRGHPQSRSVRGRRFPGRPPRGQEKSHPLRRLPFRRKAREIRISHERPHLHLPNRGQKPAAEKDPHPR